jgi:hypothetical protein
MSSVFVFPTLASFSDSSSRCKLSIFRRGSSLAKLRQEKGRFASSTDRRHEKCQIYTSMSRARRPHCSREIGDSRTQLQCNEACENNSIVLTVLCSYIAAKGTRISRFRAPVALGAPREPNVLGDARWAICVLDRPLTLHGQASRWPRDACMSVRPCVLGNAPNDQRSRDWTSAPVSDQISLRVRGVRGSRASGSPMTTEESHVVTIGNSVV